MNNVSSNNTTLIINWKVLCLLLMMVIMGLFLVWLYLPLPKPEMPLTTEIYDRNQQLITTFYRENRRQANLSEIPDFLIKAFLAVEDHRFYQHHGINPGRLLKAAWYDIANRSLAQGASTITQQLAKNTYLTQQRTFKRKLKELFYALKLELHLSKDEILELYLNQIYFGHGAYGVKVAAETYFNKGLGELNQAEMALLAGLPKGPGIYSPYTNPKAAQKRLLLTLRRMLECGYITKAEYQNYSKQPLNLPGLSSRRRPAPYFLDLLQDEIADIFTSEPGIIYTGGLIIESTLDLTVQHQAEQSFLNGLPKLTKDRHGLVQPQGALIALDPHNGEIRALIGGTDYNKSQFNRAIQAKRQPGSAFKPLLFATALSKGYTLASKIDRTPKTYLLGATAYRPLDNNNEFTSGQISLRDSLAVSSNVVAVKILESLGIETVLRETARLGITSKLPSQLSLALGSGEVTPLELSTAYLPLANGGYRLKPTTIKRIRDHNGKILYQRISNRELVLNPGVSYLLTQALTGVFKEGGTAANIGKYFTKSAAGKTGTTEDNRDTWFIGYTPDLLTCVFVGCDRYERPLPGAANRIAAPIWANFMNRVITRNTEFPIPDNIIRVPICKETGAKATPDCPNYSEFFLVGTGPMDYCYQHRHIQLKVCKVSNLLPGPHCKHTAEQKFIFGQQPTEICEQCQPKVRIFDWLQRFFAP